FVSFSIPFVDGDIKFDIELNFSFKNLDISDPSFQIVVNERSESVGLIKEYWIADFICLNAPLFRRVLITSLQEPVNVIYAVETIIVKAKNDLVLLRVLKY